MSQTPVLAIDGPSGAGKGTISRLIAARSGWHLLDSGALYRLVALAGARAGLDLHDQVGHARIAAAMPVRFGAQADGSERIELAGEEVADALRTAQAGMGASRVAAWPGVRSALMERQRAFVQPPGLVADGRDMGTVVFPEAGLKIYLVASAQERARRRYKQLKDKGSDVSLAALSREIEERDHQDQTRPVAPLVPAADALILDSTSLSIAEVVERVWQAGAAHGYWGA
jgi:cytidylate kinase